MTPLPKRRHTRARQGKRRRAIKLKNVALEKCPKCGALRRPHTLCPNCGFYKGTTIILKKERKKKEKK